MTTFLTGDAVEMLKTLPDESVNCCVTSPPYYALRDYGKSNQIGLEDTPERYITRLVEVFREVRRVLTKDGTLWINIGDTYSKAGKPDTNHPKAAPKMGAEALNFTKKIWTDGGCKPKDLIGIPWMLAFALRRDGWYLRQDIIWQKPNCMPESVTDRCTKSHEYIFLLSKSAKYYFDYKAIRELANSAYQSRYKSAFCKGKAQNIKRPPGVKAQNTAGIKEYSGYRTKRSVWTVPVSNSHAKHYAPYPKKLIEPCILAGCPEGGTVLDPFFGSGTTAIVAELNGRNCIGIDLNQEYIEIARKRVDEETRNGNPLKIEF